MYCTRLNQFDLSPLYWGYLCYIVQQIPSCITSSQLLLSSSDRGNSLLFPKVYIISYKSYQFHHKVSNDTALNTSIFSSIKLGDYDVHQPFDHYMILLLGYYISTMNKVNWEIPSHIWLYTYYDSIWGSFFLSYLCFI